MEVFSERLKNLRLEFGLSTRELGRKIGVANASICRWENGERTPNIETLITLAKFFNVSTDYLCGLED